MKNGDIQVFNRGWFWLFYGWVNGLATCGTDGKCQVTFNWWGNRPDISKGPNYNVLSTDYENYVIVYSCADRSDGSKSENAWIMTRKQKIKAEKLKEYEKMLKVLYPSFD